VICVSVLDRRHRANIQVRSTSFGPYRSESRNCLSGGGLISTQVVLSSDHVLRFVDCAPGAVPEGDRLRCGMKTRVRSFASRNPTVREGSFVTWHVVIYALLKERSPP
jgi:hypothetical protein